jgi:hypothetical protein
MSRSHIGAASPSLRPKSSIAPDRSGCSARAKASCKQFATKTDAPAAFNASQMSSAMRGSSSKTRMDCPIRCMALPIAFYGGVFQGACDRHRHAVSFVQVALPARGARHRQGNGAFDCPRFSRDKADEAAAVSEAWCPGRARLSRRGRRSDCPTVARPSFHGSFAPERSPRASCCGKLTPLNAKSPLEVKSDGLRASLGRLRAPDRGLARARNPSPRRYAHDIALALGHAIVIHPPALETQRAFKTGTDVRTPKPYLERNKGIVQRPPSWSRRRPMRLSSYGLAPGRRCVMRGGSRGRFTCWTHETGKQNASPRTEGRAFVYFRGVPRR